MTRRAAFLLAYLLGGCATVPLEDEGQPYSCQDHKAEEQTAPADCPEEKGR